MFNSTKPCNALSRSLLNQCIPLPVVLRVSRLRCERAYSSYSVPAARDGGKYQKPPSADAGPAAQEKVATGLDRLPTSSLLRNYFMCTLFTSPILFRLGFTVLRKVADSRWKILDPDRNPVLRAIVKPMIYDQFCAGTNLREISHTRDTIKGMGFSGIILCYGKEIQVSGPSNELRSTGAESADATTEINFWRDGNLETLDMVGEGDWLGMKLSGAGVAVTTALMRNEPPPVEFTQAMDSICQKAKTQNCRLWIDAEQQALQPAIDKWTIDLMRKYNQGSSVLVYNTLQAYLKESRHKLKHQLALADKEGWTLAVKLVRGAYIANDQRQKIHDTKQDTDDSYNGIVRDLLCGTNLGFAPEKFPRMQLFLAGHNPYSVNRAWDLVQELSKSGQLKVVPDFGQLQGMADELGCRILQRQADLLEVNQSNPSETAIVPRIYKCLTWGSVRECMQYLLRRIVENRGGADRMRDGMSAYYSELKRRAFGRRVQT